jgi:DNA-binding NtrC family response regulator
MAATTLAAASTTPVCELRSAPTERIVVIEHDGALRKILRRLFSSEGYEVDVVSMVSPVWRCFVNDHPPQ